MSFRYRWEATRELWRRYKEVVKYFWQRRKEMDLPALSEEESEFLPAALSLQTKPVSPVGRWSARILMALFTAIVLWAVFGHVDVIVNSNGKIIPFGQPKTIASIEVAKVTALYVQEGQYVKAGQVLLELDTRIPDSERDKAEGERQLVRLQVLRCQTFLRSIDTNQDPVLPKLDGIPEDKQLQEAQHLREQWLEFSSKRGRLRGEISRLSQILPLLTKRANDLKELLQTGDASQHAWAEREQARIDAQGELTNNRNQLLVLESEARRQLQDVIYEAQRSLNTAQQDIRRASARSDQLKITAPVEGTVQQLQVHTVGGVVPAAQQLMQIVPQHAVLEIEAIVENKDIGFVREGQPAQVKVEAFDYTKYGALPAHVVHISRNAVEDEKRGLTFRVRVALERSYLIVNGHTVSLSSGMSTVVEIKTGSRRIIQYVLSPLIRHVRESMRER